MNTKNRIKKLLPLAVVAIAFVGLVATSASAALVLEEQFDYDAGNIDGRDGGTGFNGAWASTISHGQIYETGVTLFAAGEGTTINEDAGLYFSRLKVAGSALSRFGAAGRAQANRSLTTASQTALTGDDTTVWFSVLISECTNNKNMLLVFGTEAFADTPGRQLVAVGDGFGVSLTVGDGITDDNGDGSINACVFDNSQVATVVVGTFTPILQSEGTHHDTALIAGKINWKPNGTPDELYLFNVTDLYTEPPESAAIASITDKDLDQSAFDTIALYDGTYSIIDEIRFGTSFDGVIVALDPNAPTIDVGPDMITVSGLGVDLDPTVVNDDTEIPQRDLTYAWTAEPVDDVVFSPSAIIEAPTVTITKDILSDPSIVELTLTSQIVGAPETANSETLKVYLYSNACKAKIAAGQPGGFDLADINLDCITGLADFAVVAADWLVDYIITEPVPKP